MSEPALIRRERDLLRDFAQLAADRAQSESDVAASFAARDQSATQQVEQEIARITAQFESLRRATETEYQQVQQRAETRFRTDIGAAEREYADLRDKATAVYEHEKSRAQRDFQETRWESAALLDAAKIVAESQFKEVKNRIDAGSDHFRSIENQAIQLLDQWRQPREFTQATATEIPPDATPELPDRYERTRNLANLHVANLKNLVVPKAFAGHRLLWAFATLWFISAVSLIWTCERPFTLNHRNVTLMALSLLGPIVLGLTARVILGIIAKGQITRECQPMVQAISDGEAIGKRWRAAAADDLTRQHAELRARHEQEVGAAEERFRSLQADAKQRREVAIAEFDRTYPPRFQEITATRDRELRDAEAKYPILLRELREKFEQDSAAARDRNIDRVNASEAQREADWDQISRSWWQGLARVKAEELEINQQCRALFPDWRSTPPREWKPPLVVPSAIRYGEFHVRTSQIPNATPSDERLRSAMPESLTLPALLPFPAGFSTCFKTFETGRPRAVESLQAIMLRLLTSIPAGKVRFTIIDPVGLGENFAAFMHLADFDEALVNNRIWTEPQHIDQRLSDLTEHMENVIQKYLRNEFDTIEQYNAQAGEVAEPFRIVVVANFPANFTEAAAHRLVSIAASGARCGVYTLVSVDTRLPMPHGFNLSDLEQYAVCFLWDGNRFVSTDPAFAKFPLQLDSPPPTVVFTDLLQMAGEKAKEASRVEVPFEFIAPTPSRYWLGDSRPGVNVPLGRAGATKTQNLRLGQGTSQHVLVAGKTGSGKSTLLHVLITNVSLMYSPDEIELYLVDFKKGVEFKTYATYELPHARVVAIESEREFGLSVLQRLDDELRRRGDLFRQAGVQDLGGYRNLNGGTPLPRVLLIVDEFQEFFVEDDRIAQESTLLLDRLVRQGRAFGIHVQLGSQTLGGAYSLARSTLGQMAVRIALQCSESDAHLILSDDNTAARLLSRPGEAIYNDANGLIEGNNFFQIVWLSDEQREEYLRRIQELARKRNYTPPTPQIVFEGNVPSDIRKNHLLQQALASPRRTTGLKAPTAWVGEAVAIKEPTAAIFRPQVGSNLLLVGQQDDSALAIMISTMISLAVAHDTADEQGPSSGARFVILDGSQSDAPHSGIFDKLCNVLPHSIQIAGPREMNALIQSISDTVDRRQKASVLEEPSIYLCLFDLQRFRDLRRQDEDFGFSRRGEEKTISPAKQFATILRDGPSHRVHSIVWCDSLNNLNRTFERHLIREFDMRILFQMSAGDSSTIIDSPVASKLGVNRAIYFSEEDAVVEKFRPYGLPTDDWLAAVRDQLNSRPTPLGAVTSR
jgi:S-DNA-T family DNA segregation ATPase FtsK/SpoIIIE